MDPLNEATHDSISAVVTASIGMAPNAGSRCALIAER
jgi:hypothetical protein